MILKTEGILDFRDVGLRDLGVWGFRCLGFGFFEGIGN